MSNLHILLAAMVILYSCGTYRNYQQTPNPALFKSKGDFQFSGDIGSSGAAVKTSVAISNNLGVMGSFNGGLYTYGVKEGEIGIGYYHGGDHLLFLVGGLGFGSNYGFSDSTRTTRTYEGDFVKPFIQVNTGVKSGELIWGLRGDFVGMLKATHLNYNGRHLNGSNDQIKSSYLVMEPGILVGFGSKLLRFDICYGIPISMVLQRGLDSYSDARTFPGSVSIGLRFVFD